MIIARARVPAGIVGVGAKLDHAVRHGGAGIDMAVAAGGKALAVSADVAKGGDISAAFDKIRRELGDVDALLYNAAMRPFGKLMDTKSSTFENTWRVSTFGAFLAAQEVVPAMLKRGNGTIIFTGATAGVKPFATSAAFGPAKFAMRGLAQVSRAPPGRWWE